MVDQEKSVQYMERATISADIVSSTALSTEELTLLQSEIRRFLEEVSGRSQGGNWGRLFKGDAVEIFLLNPHEALRTALLLKVLVKKTFSWKKDPDNKRELFRKYGVRLAIGIGGMRIADKKQDILDGEAIYYSGRLLEKQKHNGSERIVLKKSMFFCHKNAEFTEQMDVILELLDVLLKNATSRQSEVVYYKLLGKNEKEIAKMLNVRQHAVNQLSNAVGWKAVESAVNYFEKLNFEP